MAKLDKDRINDRIKELVSILNDANYSYYTLDDPNLSDFEYDQYFRELKILEKENPELKLKNSPTDLVGIQNFEITFHFFLLFFVLLFF